MSEEARKKAKDDAWCKVSYEGYEGWIQNLYLTEYGELVKTDSQSEWSEGPAFDCQKAQGSIETLVCKEPELAELDRKMDTVYQAALAAAKSLDDRPERAVKYLKASQRGWIKGRNECWKEPDDQFGCTKKEYQRRIALLQASWSLVNASEAVRYVCADQREEFYVTSYETDGVPAVAVEYGDTRQPLVLWKDSLYTGEKGRAVTLNGEQATLSWGPSQPDKVCRQP
ncbi:DUF1311 domain-containing protein [Aestuariicella sp. G3-2]|nr:DUF1311 domain-containing protein [Aestuariicella albida]